MQFEANMAIDLITGCRVCILLTFILGIPAVTIFYFLPELLLR